MAEGRFLSKSIATSGQLKRVSLEADYLFTRMIPHADRDGRLDGDPDVVKGTVCPLRSEITAELVGTCLAELDSVGLIMWYDVDGRQVVWFPKFQEHQKGMRRDRERTSRLPSHESQGAKSVRATTSVSLPTSSGKSREDDGKRPPKLREVKSREVKGSAAAEVRSSWVAEGSEWWSLNVGSVPIPRFGKALKDAVDLHGWPKVFPAMKCYAEEQKSRGKPARLEWLAAEIVRWVEWSSMPGTDEFGDLTPRGRAALGLSA